MAEGIKRNAPRPGLAGYFGGSVRELGRSLKGLLRDADRDTDVVSITVLSQGPRGDNLRADGAVIVIKGGNYVELFEQWAKRCGLLTPGKPIVDADQVDAADAYEAEEEGDNA